MSSPTRRPLSRRRGGSVALVAAVLVAASPGAPTAQQQSAPAGDARRVFVPMPVAVRALADNVYQATGNGNSHLVHTPEGNVVFDTGNAPAGQADDHYRLLRESVPGPIRYVIYSHSHADHIGGHPYWIAEGPEIVAHREFEEEQRYLRELAPLQRRRLQRLRPDLAARPRRSQQQPRPAPIVPDIRVGDRDHVFELGGVRFEVLDTPGAEGADNVSLWLPGQRMLFTGDTLGFIWPGFPNIFTMRGEKIRKPMEYIRTLERFIALQPDMLVPSHHDPIVGRDRVLAGLRKVRDAVRYVHDAVVAGMNARRTVHEVMAEVTLPPELDLPQGHGRVSWAVKSIWEYYATWFHFDSTTELYPVPARDVYGELADLVGADALLARAREHLAGGRPLHALHFIEMALGGAPEHVAALRLYLDAHERLLAESRTLNNAYEQNYLRSEIDKTEAALESLQPPR